MECQKLLNRAAISEEEKEDESSLWKRVWKESKVMWIVAAPAIFTRFSSFGLNVISQAFVGHIGPRELAAFALVFTVLIRFANGILHSTCCRNHFSLGNSCHVFFHFLFHHPNVSAISKQERHHCILGSFCDSDSCLSLLAFDNESEARDYWCNDFNNFGILDSQRWSSHICDMRVVL
ncbi:hypothetical protein V8G54_020688 [Vigna mungo]|uniref:Uncharacterized protein n=1 Tax=Vigna mungo TaxID=3915 RepID=A0AAQ3NED6_VIGMU